MSETSTSMIDVLENKAVYIDGLLDGKGSVELVDVHPRIVPKGYTSEYLAVRAARTSYGLGLKDPVTDSKLLRYLFVHKHTSPLEMCGVTLRLVIPKANCIHFLRHRTGKFNEFSQRYAEVPEESNYYNPLKYENGIRLQSKTNKQGSDVKSTNLLEDAKTQEIQKLMLEANKHIDSLRNIYHQMIQAGLAKEIARYWLPMSEYTTIYVQFDLNNLLKMVHLRADDEHAQWETVVYAQAISKLVKPLFPAIFDAFEDCSQGMYLTRSEIDSLISGVISDKLGKLEKETLKKKAERLNINII